MQATPDLKQLLQATFSFMLPLAGLALGLNDEGVALLTSVPYMVGACLFWLGRLSSTMIQ